MAGLNENDDEVVRPGPARAAPVASNTLAAAAARLTAPVSVVLDGGHFEDLPTRLAGAGLLARSLFLPDVARDVQRHGPWLVLIRQPADIETVLGLVGPLPAAIFWSCPAGDVALYGHLRRLNMARIPRWAAAGKTAPDLADAGTEPVLFRHWDPRVLGALMPVLDEAQFARVMGPAAEMCFDATDFGGLKRVVSDPSWPAAPGGLLTIRDEQIGVLSDRRLTGSHHRIARYLKDVAPEFTDRMSHDALLALVSHSDATGRELGLSSEEAQGRWAFITLISRGQAGRTPEIRAFLTRGDDTPDRQVVKLLNHAAASFGGGPATQQR